jgi:ABC-type Mn2+/Zn2+ transport system permease subunit
VIAWFAGVLASAGGIGVSFRYDLPTGPVVVCVFGVLLLLAYIMRRTFGREPVAA